MVEIAITLIHNLDTKLIILKSIICLLLLLYRFVHALHSWLSWCALGSTLALILQSNERYDDNGSQLQTEVNLLNLSLCRRCLDRIP